MTRVKLSAYSRVASSLAGLATSVRPRSLNYSSRFPAALLNSQGLKSDLWLELKIGVCTVSPGLSYQTFRYTVSSYRTFLSSAVVAFRGSL